MDEFDNAFNNALIGSVVETSDKQEEITESNQTSGEDSPKPVLQHPTDGNTDSQPIRKRGRRKKDVADSGITNEAGHFSCLCDSTMIAKVRAIAWKEHMTVRAVVESMFSKCIAKYEKKNGPVQIDQSRSSEDLF